MGIVTHSAGTAQLGTVDEALRLAKLGYHVVQVYAVSDGRCTCDDPERCRTPGKHPVGGDKQATTDEATIAAWWAARPNANVGLNLRRSGLVDVSSDSASALVDFRAKGLPETGSFQSGSGPDHQHHLLRAPDGCPAVRECRTGAYDLMSSGIAVLPPSVSSKGSYEWLRRLDVPVSALPEAPGWVVEELREWQERSYASSEFPIDFEQPPVRLAGEALDRWTAGPGRSWNRSRTARPTARKPWSGSRRRWRGRGPARRPSTTRSGTGTSRSTC